MPQHSMNTMNAHVSNLYFSTRLYVRLLITLFYMLQVKKYTVECA